MPNNSTLNSIFLSRVLTSVAPFFHLSTPRDVAATIALQQIMGLGNSVPNQRLQPSAAATTLIDIILNTSEGSYSTTPITGEEQHNVLAQLSAIMANSQTTAETRSSFQRFIKIYYYGTVNASANNSLNAIASPTIGAILGSNTGNDEIRKRISCYTILSPYVTPASKGTELASLWFNGVPTIELARAVPYLDIRFISGREVVDDNGRLNSMSIYKFLEGAVRTERRSTLSTIIMANTTAGSITGARNTSGRLSESGMELFSMPQTLINANVNFEADSGQLRSVPVRDPMRPFATFKNLNITVAPSVGLISYKTAELEFVLHDVSRMAEIADFLSPDLYGTTELLMEYGWNHPDGPEKSNVYADLMNYSRSKEKYMIRNISFTMTEGGEATIKLSLAMKGGTDFTTENIATTNPATRDLLRRIEELGAAIARYRDSRPGANSNSGTGSQRAGTNRRQPEIRGHQILDFAGDWQNHLQVPPEMLRHLNEFIAATNTPGANPDTTLLRQNLVQLYGNRTSNARVNSTNSDSQVSQLSTNIQAEINATLIKIFSTGLDTDPFLPNITVVRADNTRQSILTPRPVAARASGGPATITRPSSPRAQFVSLGKLLLHFIAIPLSSTNKFDDVQLIFYPFNDSAGYANSLNISQFVIDANYFFEQYVRFRLESTSRAGNVSLNDFITFVANTLIDDPMATTYGIGDLYTQTRNAENNTIAVAPRQNAVEFQTSLENRLRRQTPNGDFKMPQLSCFVEALPLRRNLEGQLNLPNSDKTILRLHFYDRQATPYQGQVAILQGSRDGVLNSISNIPSTASGPEGRPEVLDGHRETVQRIIDDATNNDIIQRVPNNSGVSTSEHPPYMITGGQKAIKEYIMKTMPYIIYGAQGTTIKSAQLNSMQDPALSTVNMLRSARAGPLRANGEQPGGLPLRIIPCELSVAALGCSLIDFAQQFFIDFGTGTTADNIYGVNGITHKIEAGSYETEIKFVPLDAYGRYTSFLERINQASITLEHLAPR